MKLVNASEMLKKAYEGKYAVPHFNINNLEVLKAILVTCEEEKSPVIIGVSEGAIKYMCGVNTVAGMIKGMVEDLNLTIPVALHLDHGSEKYFLSSLKAGFTSVMFDGSKLSFEENLKKTAEMSKLAKKYKASFEAEIGAIGENKANGELATVEQALAMTKAAKLDVLAAGIGNIHGPYPADWKSLNFDRLKELHENAKMGIVLHGGSGIPKDQVKKAISLGVTKINVNTELQISCHDEVRKYIIEGHDLEAKNYDPRKWLKPGYEAMCKTVKELIEWFGSNNKA